MSENIHLEKKLRFLIKQLKKDDPKSFRAIFDLLHQPLYNFVASYTKSHEATQDILQDVFVKIWNYRYNIDKTKSFKSFVFTLTKNYTFDYLRKLSKEKKIVENYDHHILNLGEASKLEYEQQNYLKSLLEDIHKKLSKQQQSILNLLLSQDANPKEIADLLGIKLKTVQNNISLIINEIKQFSKKNR